MSDTEQPAVAPDEVEAGNERGDSPTETAVEVEIASEELKDVEAAVEEPKNEEVAVEQPKDEEVETHPKAEDEELSVSNIVPSEFEEDEEEPATANEDIALEPVEGEEGVAAAPKEGGDEDELMLAPVDVEDEHAVEGEKGVEGEGEGKEAGEGGEGKEEGEAKEAEATEEGVEGEAEEGKATEEGEAAQEEEEPVEEYKEMEPIQPIGKMKHQRLRAHRADSIDDEAEIPAHVGDFMVRDSSSTDGFVFDAVVVSSSSSEEEEEEEVPEEIEEEDLVIDREYYTETYRQLLQERAVLKRKNTLLQKKLVDHYRKRKMESVYKDVLPQALDLEPKYAKKLQAYDEMRTIEERERFVVNTELLEMKSQRDDLAVELAQELDALIQKERETGTGLINSKTGKPIPDKLVERFLKRQQNKCKDIAKCRLAFIKLRDKVNEKETALKELEMLGDNLHLIDYEQLRMENQNLADKIEERDDELTRLRVRTTQCIQVLAHVREKSHATLADIESQKDCLKDVEDDVIRMRESLNHAKRRRDMLREETRRNQEEAGLLTKPKLLRDFEESIAMVEIETNRLKNIKTSFAEEAKALQLARSSLVDVDEEYRNMKYYASHCNAARRATYLSEEKAKLFPRLSQIKQESDHQISKEEEEDEEPMFQM